MLKDPKKKAIYDKYGNAVKKLFALLSSFLCFSYFTFLPSCLLIISLFLLYISTLLFPFFGETEKGLERRKGRGEEEKGENIGFEVPVTLSELYNGATKQVNFRKTVLCEKCGGEGVKSKESKRKVCGQCEGKGARMMMRQVGPFMTSQQVKCSGCDGNGEVVPVEERCVECRGKKISQKNHSLQVFVEKGMREGQKIVFHGEAHQEPNVTPGDVVVVLREHEEESLEFSQFSREGNDILCKKTISLRQALIGFKFELTHLDGRTLLVTSPQGSIIKPGEKKVIENEGMPLYKNPLSKGRLVIEFDVEFPPPGTFDEETKNKLGELLKQQEEIEEKVGEASESGNNEPPLSYSFTDYEELEEDDKKKRQAYEEDDEEEERGGQEGVGCRFM